MKTPKSPTSQDVAASQSAPIARNSHFKFAERAPYELGFLLSAMPPDFSSFSPATSDVLLMAEAAANHADNASDTILRGLEAIGACLFSAIGNPDLPIDSGNISSLASLIKHLAVEAQLMREKQLDLEFALAEHRGRR